ncbi:MAG TPA: hypothetical protein VE971_04440 [Candidatus Eisenbacteria bacterium]|nr:hypothetical protein [Candidatus Eisenbacteria bacterium]
MKIIHQPGKWIPTLGTNADVTNLHGLFHTLGIPVSGGLALGILAGFVGTR